MTINSLHSTALEKICSYLQDADLKAFLKAFEERSQTVQTVAKNELENRDKELERLLSPYQVASAFNIRTLKDVNLLLVGDEHGNEQYLSDRSALLYFLARRGPVVFVTEGTPSMQKIEDISEVGFCGDKEAFLIQSQSLNPTFKENIHSIGWDDQEELHRLRKEINQKYSELEKSIDEAKMSLSTKLPNELRISQPEWTKLQESLYPLALGKLSSRHDWLHLVFSIYLQKVGMKEIYFLQCLTHAKKYFAYLDSTKQGPRIEDFEKKVLSLKRKRDAHLNAFNSLSNEDLEELYRKKLEKSIIKSEKNFGLIYRDLTKQNKTIALLKKTIKILELYNKVEKLFSSLKTQQDSLDIGPESFELEQKIRSTLLSIISNWNLIGIGEKLPLKLPLIKISNFPSLSEDLPISMLMKKLRFFKMHFLQDFPVKLLKELLSYLEEHKTITNNQYTLQLKECADFSAAITKTFPTRTTSMADTLKKLDSYILSLGLQQPTIVLLAGGRHLINNETSSEYDLTTLYAELNKHNAAILIPSGPSLFSKLSAPTEDQL